MVDDCCWLFICFLCVLCIYIVLFCRAVLCYLVVFVIAFSCSVLYYLGSYLGYRVFLLFSFVAKLSTVFSTPSFLSVVRLFLWCSSCVLPLLYLMSTVLHIIFWLVVLCLLVTSFASDFLVFFSTPPPPRSTFFPSTSLFRSCDY